MWENARTRLCILIYRQVIKVRPTVSVSTCLSSKSSNHNIDITTSMLRDNLVEHLAVSQDLVGLDLDVGGLATALGVGLVDQDPSMRESEALTRCSGREQHRRG